MSELEDLFDDLDRATGDVDYDKERREIVKAPLGWAGGKSKCLDKILPHLPYYTGYIEPFGGMMSVLLARRKSKLEVYNDRYGGVVDFYRCLRDEKMYLLLIEKLEHFIHSREEWYWCYDNWYRVDDPVQRAAAWYYMMTYSFAKRGDAFGRSTHSKNATAGLHLKNSLQFRGIHDRIKEVMMENLDFRQIFKDYGHPENVFYCDPPYLDTTKTSYFGSSFTEQDHKDLLTCIFNCSSFVAVSGHNNDFYDKYPWDNKITWEQYRSIKRLDHDKEHLHEEIRNQRTTNHTTETLWIKERQ